MMSTLILTIIFGGVVLGLLRETFIEGLKTGEWFTFWMVVFFVVGGWWVASS